MRRAWIMCVPCCSVARPTKFDKVVRREICQVSTQGIRSFSQRDGDVGDAQPSYLLALCEVSGVCVWGGGGTMIGGGDGVQEDMRHMQRIFNGM